MVFGSEDGSVAKKGCCRGTHPDSQALIIRPGDQIVAVNGLAGNWEASGPRG